jgi:hypothetical protein
MIDFFNAGPLMDEAGDTGGGGGAETALATTTETALTTTADVQTTDDTTDETTDLVTQPDRVLENGRPSKSTSAALQTLKATHPELARQVPRALGIVSRLNGEFPGQNPFDGIKSQKRALTMLAGRYWNSPDPGDPQHRTGVQQVLDQLADMEKLDLLYASGNPQMLDQMTETPEARISFTKIAPHVIDKLSNMPEGKAALAKIAPKAWALYQSIAPNAYNSYMAATIAADMLAKDIDVHIKRLVSLIPADNEIGKASAAAIDAYFKRLDTLKNLTPEVVPDVTDTGKDPRQEEFDRREQAALKKEQEITAREWKSSADSAKNRIAQQAWATETKGRRIDAVAKEDIEARIASRLPLALKGEPGFSEALEDFWKAGDRDGYLRYLQSMHAKHLPRIIRAEIQRRFPSGATATTTTRTTPAAQTRTAPEAGFKRVNAMPHMNTVNSRATNADMWKKKQAVLKDGTKVSWG